MASRKKEEFTRGNNSYRGPNRVVLFIAFFAAIAVAVSFLALQTSEAPTASQRYERGNYHLGEERNYQGQTIAMTTVDHQIEGGKIYLSLEQVKNNNLVYTGYQKEDGSTIPLMAYITPQGRLVAAFAMCEPCRSLSFHIEDEILVCDTCATKWYLENLAGISGGCTTYPPEEMPYQVENGQIILDEALVKSWTPRV